MKPAPVPEHGGWIGRETGLLIKEET